MKDLGFVIFGASGSKDKVLGQSVTRQPADTFGTGIVTLEFITVTLVLRSIAFCRVGHEKPLVNQIIFGHSFPIVSNGKIIIVKCNLHLRGMSIIRVFYKLKNGYIRTRDQIPAQNVFQLSTDTKLQIITHVATSV